MYAAEGSVETSCNLYGCTAEGAVKIQSELAKVSGETFFLHPQIRTRQVELRLITGLPE